MTATPADDPASSAFWPRTFTEARRHDDWFEVPRTHPTTEAISLALDITNAHRQDAAWRRSMGIRDGEGWDARVVPAGDTAALFIRLVHGMRNTFWARTFAEARDTGDWTEVLRRYTRATAQQIASDISNAHRRKLANQRVRGIIPGEVWDARWEPVDGNANGDHRVFVRLRPPDD